MANAIRALSMDAVEKAKSGHPGMPMGMADVATVLFTKHLKFDAADPHWPDRDRFVLSAGHGSMLLYSALYLLGYEDMTLDELKRFRQLGSKTAGHPEYGHAAGIETTTGPLGQGLGNAVGMALAERLMNAQFGDDLVDHHTYVIASDGDLMEGISHEAIAPRRASEARRSSSSSSTTTRSPSTAPKSLSDSTDQVKRFEAAGWTRIAYRRPRPEGDRQGADRGEEERPAGADRGEDNDRLRRAEEGRHGLRARLAARRRGDRRRAQGAQLALRALRRAGRRLSTHGEPGRRSRTRGARGLAEAARRSRQARRVRAAHRRRRSPPASTRRSTS